MIFRNKFTTCFRELKISRRKFLPELGVISTNELRRHTMRSYPLPAKDQRKQNADLLSDYKRRTPISKQLKPETSVAWPGLAHMRLTFGEIT